MFSDFAPLPLDQFNRSWLVLSQVNVVSRCSLSFPVSACSRLRFATTVFLWVLNLGGIQHVIAVSWWFVRTTLLYIVVAQWASKHRPFGRDSSSHGKKTCQEPCPSFMWRKCVHLFFHAFSRPFFSFVHSHSYEKDSWRCWYSLSEQRGKPGGSQTVPNHLLILYPLVNIRTKKILNITISKFVKSTN